MKRTISSEWPLGAFSDSISVSNPYLYLSTSMRRTWSTVSCTAGILPSAHGFKDRGLDWSVMVPIKFWLGSPLSFGRRQAALPCVLLGNVRTSFFQASRKQSTSSAAVENPRLTRIAPRARAGSTPMAASTGEAATLPDEQADPDDTATPSRSRAIRAVSAFTPGTANAVVLGR